MYRVSRNVLLNTSVMLLGGIIHQGTFSFFTGGFQSHVIIWFAVLPFIGAIVAGKQAAILWCGITLLTSSSFLILHLTGYTFPYLISPYGELVSQALIALGFVGLTTILSFFYLHQENKQREAQLEQKNRIENLFRVLCHDLGNPLALLQMAVEQAQQTPDTAKKTRSLEISQRAISNMVDITQNVRRMYSMREGKADVQCVPMALNAAIEQIQFLFQTPLAQKEIALHYDMERHRSTVVLVDTVSFVHQVLSNIVSNSVKFSEPKGAIYIQATPGADGHIHLQIKDEGIGMPTQIRDSLFDVQRKTTRPGTSGERGTGFGMHLMKTFVEKYGGDVEVQSEENRGTTFTLKLKGHVS